MDDLSGQTIRGYELQERIGIGGFGAVYRAYQASVDRDVAVKVILPKHTERPDFVQRFEAEARLIARLEHLHIVPLHDFWHDDQGRAFIVMRYLRGGSLRGLLRGQPLNFTFVRQVFRQIGDALSHAHRAGIVHRDIKPDNILLDRQQNAYLTDFGIAKDIWQEQDLTTTHATLGSPAYIAPEQIFGGVISEATDIYSLGMTLFECLAGTHPFPDQHVQHLQKPLPSLRTLRPDVPLEVDGVVARATAKQPELRYSTVIGMIHALEAAFTPDRAGRAEPTDRAEGGEVTEARQKGIVTTPDLGGVGVPTVDGVPDNTMFLKYDTPIVSARHPSENGQQSAVVIAELRDIPTGPEQLFGRDVVIAELEAFLRQQQSVLLHGMPGIGKTAVATGVAQRWLAAESGKILWLRVGRQDAPAIVEALARPFEKRLTITPTNLQVGVIRDLLEAQLVTLVVLDDVWHDDALHTVLDVLPPDLPVLVTSRQRYALRRIVRLDELAPSASLALLSDHAGVDFGETDTDAQDLCARLGYHPFALELAGRTLLVDELYPAELIARLADMPHRLAPLPGFGEEGGHNIEELLDASLEMLDGEARLVFLLMGALFTPAVTSELMDVLLRRPAEEALTVLARRGLLQRVRLPQTDSVIYQLHDLAHSYARSLTHISVPTLLDICRRFAEMYSDDPALLEAERTNILKAAEAAAEIGDQAALVGLVMAFVVAGDYINKRGQDSLLLHVLDLAIEAARDLGDEHRGDLHYLLAKRADTHFNRDEAEQWETVHAEAFALAEALGWRDRMCVLLALYGGHAAKQLRYEDAERSLNAAAEIAHELDDPDLIARVFEVKGYLYAVAKRDFEAARAVFEQQVRFSEPFDDPKWLINALINLGSAYHELGESDQALDALRRGLDLSQTHQKTRWVGLALANIGLVQEQQGDREAAQASFVEALQAYQSAGLTSLMTQLIRVMESTGYTVPDEFIS